MVAKNITISSEAYAYLKTIKGERSFSETILSLKRGADDILRYAGSLKNADLDSVAAVRKEANDDWNRGR
jgi:predicted CopG family antitoxin